MSEPRSLNVPNAITVGRLLLAVLLFAWIELAYPPIWLASLFVVAVLTDLLDGWIARRWQLVTPLGRILDPFADKFIVCGTLFFLLPIPERSGVTAWMVAAIVGREMFVSALRGYLERQGVDFSADWSGKIKTFVQCVGVTAALLFLGATDRALVITRDVLLWTAVGVTLYSWIAYIRRGFAALRDTPAANGGET